MNALLLLLVVCVGMGIRSHKTNRPISFPLVFLVSFLCAISFYSLRFV